MWLEDFELWSTLINFVKNTARCTTNERILLFSTPQVILDSFDRDIALANGYYIFPPYWNTISL